MDLIHRLATPRRLACTAAVMTLFAVGCGSDSNSPTATGGGSSQSASTQDAALHDALPASIRDSGVLRVSTDDTLGQPFAESSGSGVVGVDADLAQQLGDLLGVKVEMSNVPFDGLIPGLQADRADVSISSMLDTKERQQVVDFVDFFKDGSGFLVKTGSSLTNLALDDQLCGKSAAAGKGSLEVIALQDQSKKCTAAGKPPVDVQQFSGVNTALLATISGRVDLYVGSASQIAWLELKNRGKLERSGEPFGVGIVGMAFPKDSPLVPVMQRALQKLIDNGAYREMLSRYNLQDTALDKATVNHALF